MVKLRHTFIVGKIAAFRKGDGAKSLLRSPRPILRNFSLLLFVLSLVGSSSGATRFQTGNSWFFGLEAHAESRLGRVVPESDFDSGAEFDGGFEADQSENSSAASETVSFTVLHTNDLHSHFRPEKGPRGLGGYARLKTLISQERQAASHSLLLDGGDWSEGTIYYTLDTGRESLRLLDELGFDATVVGNHDWLNGPDHFLNLVEKVRPHLEFLSANLNPENFHREAEFNETVKPYIIKKIGGVRVAIVGISTYEWIYDRYLQPITIREPFRGIYALTQSLKQEGLADVVIALSHNSIWMNRAILKYAPDIDLVVGAHDHKALTQPIEVSKWPWRRGSSWIVEAGSWGRFLGKLQLSYSSEGGLTLQDYSLLAVDSTIAEDAELAAQIDQVESLIEAERGPVFHEKVAHCADHIHRHGVDNPMGNLVADAYREATNADLAIESQRFIYGELDHEDVSRADVFNINPAVFDYTTGRTWTLKLVELPGLTIQRMMDLAFGNRQISQYGLFSVSGLTFTYDPWFRGNDEENPYDLFRLLSAVGSLLTGPSVSGVQSLMVGTHPLDPDQVYRVALGEGVVEGIDFINSYIGSALPYFDLADTGLENWTILANYLGKTMATSTEERPSSKREYLSDRIRPLNQDLSVREQDIQITPLRIDSHTGIMNALITLKVRNRGMETSRGGFWSKGASIRLIKNERGEKLGLDPSFEEIGELQAIPQLAPGESAHFTWNAELSSVWGEYPVTAQVVDADFEANTWNHEATRWFRFH